MSSVFVAFSPQSLTILSLFGGAFVAASSLPALIDALREPRVEHLLQILRNTLAALGNLLWLIFGLAKGEIAIIVFCGFNATLLPILVAVQLRRWLTSIHNPKRKTHA